MKKSKLVVYTLALVAGIAMNLQYNAEAIIEQYKRIENTFVEWRMRADIKNQNIIVALSTTPYRIDKIQPTLATIFKQNVKINKIYLCVPHLFKRDNLEYVIPQWLQDEMRVTILRTDDYGPATKLLGVLEKIKSPPKTIIITVDDDMLYPPNLVLHLAHMAILYPDSAITTAGVDIDYDENGNINGPGFGTINRSDSDALVTIARGFGGVAYRSGFFDESIFEINNAPHECYMDDDFYISFYLAKQGIARRNLHHYGLSLSDIKWNEETAYKADALYNVTPDRSAIDTVCLAYLKIRDPLVKF